MWIEFAIATLLNASARDVTLVFSMVVGLGCFKVEVRDCNYTKMVIYYG